MLIQTSNMVGVSTNVEAEISLSELCTPLAAFFAFLAIISSVQLVRIIRRGIPWTTQKRLHVLVSSISICRVAFFIIAIFEWDMEKGALRGCGNETCGVYRIVMRTLFYAMDEISSILFFAILSCVALFWAELYLIASGSPAIYESFLAPFCRVVNALVFTAVLTLSCVLYNTSPTFQIVNYYVPRSYAVVVVSAYVGAAISFIWIGRNTALELKQVPIELQMRTRLLKEIRTITVLSTSCLILRATILTLIANKTLNLNDRVPYTMTMLYFIILEGAPVTLCLFFYRRMPLPTNFPHKTQGGLVSPEEMKLFQNQNSRWSYKPISVEECITRLSDPHWDPSLDEI